ncbi:MAG: biotin carboxylase N-terminal domain-containing protein, partial [Pseudomonadota bacterium]
EIAVRIHRTAARLGVSTVAVYSDADRGAMHTRVCDEAVLIGPAEARRSYLDIDRIIHAAKETGAEAIHPGYGFLSENADFAKACEAAGVVFVGPPAAAIAAMGSKAQAKTIMERAGVPVVPGYHGEMQDASFLKRKAYEVGYPVLIKAVAGGGGKGMRRVDKAIDFEEALAEAQREAKASFGDARVLLERFVERPRHIEIQVFADCTGRAVSLHERDCSVQRRHQKVMEEAPAPGMTPEVRAAMGRAAVKAAEAVGYVGAGTVEFIVSGDALTEDGFFFMEMNTRLQVEHPVTEMVTGFDLVEWQLRVAAGETLPEGEARPPKGHAVEVRLYAEDPDAGFLPSTGKLEVLTFGPGVRVDTGVEEGDAVSPYYDPMIAKLIAHGADRTAAFAAMSSALGATVAIGPRTNLPFLDAIVNHEEVLDGRHDTGFVEREAARLTGGKVSARAIADAAATLLIDQTAPPEPSDGSAWVDPWAARDGFRLSGSASTSVALSVDGDPAVAAIVPGRDGLSVEVGGERGTASSAAVRVVGGTAYAVSRGRFVAVEVVDQLAREVEEDAQGHALAPMHGRIVALFVSPGDEVARGDRLFAIEAMKMEHTVRATSDGTVAALRASVGDQVAERAEVIVFGPGTASDDGGSVGADNSADHLAALPASPDTERASEPGDPVGSEAGDAQIAEPSVETGPTIPDRT